MANRKNFAVRPKTLTSLRYFAIMLIVFHHLKGITPSWRPKGLGSLGITFFLVLSGFIIRLNYGNFAKAKDAFYFLWNRIVRIYPLHILSFCASLLLLCLMDRHINISNAGYNIFLIQS